MASPLPDPVPLHLLRRALVTKLRHHGDVLLASPVFTALRKAAPALDIDALVYAETAPMLAGHPAIAQVHTIDRDWKSRGLFTQLRGEWDLLRKLRERDYDLLVHLTEHPRGLTLARLLRPRYAVTRERDKHASLWRRHFTHFYKLPRTERHVVEQNLDALRRIGIYPDAADRGLVLVPGPAAEQRIDEILGEYGIAPREFVQVHPGSRWLFKCWPAERTAALVDLVVADGWPVMITGAPDDRERALTTAVLAAVRPATRARTIDLTGKLTLRELAALTARARAFAGVDSAPMHIAAAVGTPAVALFGPSSEAAWGPWQVPQRVIVSSHSCRPCGLDGCGGGKVSECITTLPVERVHGALASLLAETPGLMRLAIIRQRYTPHGGAERFLEGALEALLERNVAITLYTREWPQTKLQLIEPSIVDPPYAGKLWRDWGFARAVTKQIVAGKANLVQSHERVLTCDVYRPGDGVHATWLEERLRDASASLRLRVAMSPWHRYTLAMERKLFASTWLRAVLCNSKMVRDDIKARFGLPDERLPVLYNAIDAGVYSPALTAHRERVRTRHRIPQDATVFLLVGSGYRRKGVPAAMEALARLPDATHLLIVGDDRRVGAYKRLAHERGVRERVTFAGFQNEIAPYYGAADAFVLPVLYDSFPDAAMEAMACGLPVITSTRSGAAELVTEHDGGFVCDSRDVETLTAHMRTLLDPQARARLGANARSGVLPLTPAAMTLKLVLIYKELLEFSVAHKIAALAAAARAGAPTTEAKPLHGDDGLDSETLPHAPESDPSVPGLPKR